MGPPGEAAAKQEVLQGRRRPSPLPAFLTGLTSLLPSFPLSRFWLPLGTRTGFPSSCVTRWGSSSPVSHYFNAVVQPDLWVGGGGSALWASPPSGSSDLVFQSQPPVPSALVLSPHVLRPVHPRAQLTPPPAHRGGRCNRHRSPTGQAGQEGSNTTRPPCDSPRTWLPTSVFSALSHSAHQHGDHRPNGPSIPRPLRAAASARSQAPPPSPWHLCSSYFFSVKRSPPGTHSSEPQLY